MWVCLIIIIIRKALMEALEVNKTLISVDLSENPNMGLKEVQKC